MNQPVRVFVLEDANTNDRTDGLLTELNMLLTIWNAQIEFAADNQLSVNNVEIRISQDDLGALTNTGKRTVERICKRLVERGLLERQRDSQKSIYWYRTTHEQARRVCFEVATRRFVRLNESPDGKLSIEVIPDMQAEIDRIFGANQNGHT